MAKAKKLPRKRRPTVARKRPVVSVRLPDKVFADISAEATAMNVAISEVVFRRLMSHARHQWQADELAAFERQMQGTEEDRRVEAAMLDDDIRDVGAAVAHGIKTIEAIVERGIANLEFAVGAAVERAVAAAMKDRPQEEAERALAQIDEIRRGIEGARAYGVWRRKTPRR
jgi:hypothetical protein